jgi:hypothetical protein
VYSTAGVRAVAVVVVTCRAVWPQLKVRVNETCKALCARELKKGEVRKFVNKIRKEFSMNWCVSGLLQWLLAPCFVGVQARVLPHPCRLIQRASACFLCVSR